MLIQQHAEGCHICSTGALCKVGIDICARAVRVRKFALRLRSRATEAFGACDYTITETVTEQPTGVLVKVESRGTCEGERVDATEERFREGVSFESACSYRLRIGFHEVQS